MSYGYETGDALFWFGAVATADQENFHTLFGKYTHFCKIVHPSRKNVPKCTKMYQNVPNVPIMYQ